jgi:hypothetical protein
MRRVERSVRIPQIGSLAFADSQNPSVRAKGESEVTIGVGRGEGGGYPPRCDVPEVHVAKIVSGRKGVVCWAEQRIGCIAWGAFSSRD